MEFLQELSVFLVAALAVVPLLNRLGLSSVIGYLVAGVVIGPSVLGLIDDADGVLHFAEIGVVLLLFVIGLELQPRRLWVMRKAVFGLGGAQVLCVTLALGAVLGLGLGQGMQAALILAFALALSSTAFVLQLLAEKKQLNHAHGRAAFGVLLLQDVAVIPAIVYLNTLGSSSGHGGEVSPLAVGLIVLLVVAARFLLRPILRFVANTGIHELFIAASLAIVCGAALAMHWAGLSMGLGAFIAGMLVADSEYRHQLETDVMPFKGLLLGLFFIAVGMSADLTLLVSDTLLILGLTFALVLVKTLVMVPLALAYGLGRADAMRAALVLSQGGEFAFVLLTTAVSVGALASATMEMAVLVVTLSMASTPFLLQALERLLSRGGSTREFDEPLASADNVIIAGFGRFGQIVGRILNMQQRPFTAMDISPGQVDFVREFGNEVYYGDATRLDLLRTAGVGDASAIVIAVDDVEASVRIAEQVREAFPMLPVLARARNRQHEIKLRDLGVQHVIRDTLLSSLSLSRDLAGVLGLEADAVDAFAHHDAQTLQRQAAVIHDEQAFRQTAMDAEQELRELFAEDKAGGKRGARAS